MNEREVRDRVYARYVTDKMGLVRQYDERAYERWSQNTYRQIARWLPEDRTARILDAGCGPGNLLHLLTSRGYRQIEGVDRSAEQVALARRIADQVECGDVFEYLRDREATFDLVLAFDLLEHFRKVEVLEFLDLVFRALRPGGSLMVQTPNADSPWSSSIRYGDFTHEIAFNPHSLEHVLRLAGFVEYEARETGPVVHGVRSAIRWVTWQMIRGALAVWNLSETGSAGDCIYTRVFRARATRP
jgi:SAM-dependent methyltransferase